MVDQVSGEPLVLECEVSRENAEVRWLKDGVELELDGDVTVTEEGLIRRLTILSPSGKDSGKYTCDAGGDAIDFKVNVKRETFDIFSITVSKTNSQYMLRKRLTFKIVLSALLKQQSQLFQAACSRGLHLINVCALCFFKLWSTY